MSTIDPFAPGTPVGDYHSWALPTSEPCPDCECCSKRLCEQARAKDSACHMEGRSADFDLSECPCWRQAPARNEPTYEEIAAEKRSSDV